ncbi:1-phosphofructokinase [Joostella atrarenae]|uniref:1-phosphofructokinase n=1 Tax=Joostella atrarenae TaxID=679257 RepID=A0ABS9J2U4_9FLAO|nr:PfkB family carbohydrate kinase [Joostella atrarenae]MCF8714760.1 1-phosphofructokinase [Joostella atrarenae]
MILSVCPNPSIDTYAWLDTIESGLPNRISELKQYPGGKATHIAMALSELKQENTLLGNWAGTSGTWIKQECQLRDINISGIELEGQNRKCYTFRSPISSFNNTELLEPGPTFKEEDWNPFLEIFKTEASKSSLICVSGSWPKGAPEDAYSKLIDICNTIDKRIIIDCSGAQLKNALTKSFFGIHINEDELKSIYNNAPIEAIVKELSPKINLIAITKGKEGLWLYYNGKFVHANVVIDQVISTVGSGDCLTAGIAYAVNNNMNIEDIAKYGVACGAANCLNEDLGILKLEDVENLLPKVKIKENTYAA